VALTFVRVSLSSQGEATSTSFPTTGKVRYGCCWLRTRPFVRKMAAEILSQAGFQVIEPRLAMRRHISSWTQTISTWCSPTCVCSE
jgi:hypothetical protein